MSAAPWEGRMRKGVVRQGDAALAIAEIDRLRAELAAAAPLIAAGRWVAENVNDDTRSRRRMIVCGPGATADTPNARTPSATLGAQNNEGQVSACDAPSPLQRNTGGSPDG